MLCLSHKTAITRKVTSAPMKVLHEKGLLIGRMLDYGCGKGRDAIELDMNGYDPYYQPTMPYGYFDTITCNYMLNVIESDVQRLLIVQDILYRLNKDGKAYITVRTDKKALIGRTSKGTWQGLIMMNLPVVARGSGFAIYELRQSEQLKHVSIGMETFP